jgi:hypothetical protein
VPRLPFSLPGLVGTIAVLALLPPSAIAQAPAGEAALRSAFEGTSVRLRIDMPGTSDGVDVGPDGRLDDRQRLDRIKRFGVSLRAGDRVTVTLVKVKKDLIEFQLNGGGYGVFGDDTSTSVDMPDVAKSNREKDLETRVKNETDPQRKRQLQLELDDVRKARERENRRIASERSIAEAAKQQLIARRRLDGGSRFNVRYAGTVPAGVTARELVTVLSEYVDFSPADGQVTPPPAPASPAGTRRTGLLRADAARVLGAPLETAERREGTLRVVSLVFRRGDERITAEFVEDVLIRYTITVR